MYMTETFLKTNYVSKFNLFILKKVTSYSKFKFSYKKMNVNFNNIKIRITLIMISY